MALADDLAVRDQWTAEGKRVAAATVISVAGSLRVPPVPGCCCRPPVKSSDR